MIYENVVLKGPYKSPQGRELLYYITKTKRKTNKWNLISYPKFIAELHLNRFLKNNETVDHINNDFLDNSLSNLRIMLRRDHSKEDSKILIPVKFNCLYCEKEIWQSSGKLSRLASRIENGQRGPFCSRSCSGKYDHSSIFNKNNSLDKIRATTRKEVRRDPELLKLFIERGYDMTPPPTILLESLEPIRRKFDKRCQSCDIEFYDFYWEPYCLKYREKGTCIKESRKIKRCLDCNININKYSTRCRKCAAKKNARPKIEWPSLEELKRMVKESSYTKVGDDLGVTGKAVSKHIEKREKRNKK